VSRNAKALSTSGWVPASALNRQARLQGPHEAARHANEEVSGLFQIRFPRRCGPVSYGTMSTIRWHELHKCAIHEQHMVYRYGSMHAYFNVAF